MNLRLRMRQLVGQVEEDEEDEKEELIQKVTHDRLYSGLG